MKLLSLSCLGSWIFSYGLGDHGVLMVAPEEAPAYSSPTIPAQGTPLETSPR